MLIFHDYFVVKRIFFDIILVECKLVRGDIIFVILETAEADYIDFTWKIMELRAKFFDEQTPMHNSGRIMCFVD